SEDQTYRLFTNELTTDQECIRETSWFLLFGIRELQAPAFSVAEEFLKRRRVFRHRDDQDVPDTRQHQKRQRVINHRLVVNRQELLTRADGQRKQTRASPTS